MSTDLAEQADAVALAKAIVGVRLVDGPETSPDDRVVQLIRSIAVDIDDRMRDHMLSPEAQDDLLHGLSRYAMVCGALAEVAANIIRTGQRSGFTITNLDEFLTSPYVLPEVECDHF